MPFASYVFVLVFLPLLVLLWRAVAVVHKPSLGLVLLGASLLLCLWASPAALVLLCALVFVNYGLGLALASPGEREGSLKRKGLLVLALVVNFAPLVLVRYHPVLLHDLPALFLSEGPVPGSLLGGTGETGGLFTLETAKLAGLSFFALVQCAWLVSIYQRHVEPEGLMRHGLFSLAFPYLLAGPIVRYEQMGRQYDLLDAPLLPQLAAGLGLFITGLCKKVLLADWLGSHADAVFAAAAAGEALTRLDAWLGVLAFSFQIYFDFSGYTDMALGIGLMLGLRLPENFQSPYRATGFIEFWRRWHMTLSAFLRDFVYKPVCGPWPSLGRIFLAVGLCLVVSALWHGTGLTFLVWAALHGVFLFLNAGLRAIKGPGMEALLASAPMRVFCAALTFCLVSLLWVVFRADSGLHALNLYEALVVSQAGADAGLLVQTSISSLVPLVAAALVVFLLPTAHEIFLGKKDGEKAWLSFAPTLPWAIVLSFASFACLTVLDLARPFIF